MWTTTPGKTQFGDSIELMEDDEIDEEQEFNVLSQEVMRDVVMNELIIARMYDCSLEIVAKLHRVIMGSGLDADKAEARALYKKLYEKHRDEIVNELIEARQDGKQYEIEYASIDEEYFNRISDEIDEM